MHPRHLVSIGRYLIAYEGRDAFVCGHIFQNSSVVEWIPSPAHRLQAPCVAVYGVCEGALAYDADGLAYRVTVEGVALTAGLEWNPALSIRKAAKENEEWIAGNRALGGETTRKKEREPKIMEWKPGHEHPWKAQA